MLQMKGRRILALAAALCLCWSCAFGEGITTPTDLETPAPTPVPAYVSKTPTLNEAGFLDEGEFIYSSEDEGLWIFINQTCRIIIERKYDASMPLTWFEAEIWSDVEAGEMLRTIQNDP